MKKHLLPLLLLLCLITAFLAVPVSAVGDAGTITSLWGWSFEDGTLTIAGSGPVVLSDKNYLTTSDIPWYQYKNQITRIVIGNGITHIGHRTFSHLPALTELVLGSGLQSIGEAAFANLTTLTTLTIPDSVTYIGVDAFTHNNLTEIHFGSGLQTIDDRAFYYSWSLPSVNIPDNVKTIGDSAFAYSEKLTTVHLGSGLQSIGDSAFYWNRALTTVTRPAGLTTDTDGLQTIGDSAFDQCKKLTSFDFGPSLQTVGAHAFDGTNLDSITLGDCVTTVGANAFRYNYRAPVTLGKSLQTIGDSAFYNTAPVTITLPDSLTSIGEYAFANCNDFTEVHFGSGLQTIGDYAFNDNPLLTSIQLPESVTQIGKGAFSSCDELTAFSMGSKVETIGGYAFDNSPITELVLPETLTSLGEYAFSCTEITHMTLPESITVIPKRLFSGCRYLESVTLGSQVTTVGNSAFSACNSLSRLVLPQTVTTLGDDAFSYSDSLTELVLPKSLTAVGQYTFAGCQALEQLIFTGDAPAFQSNTFYDSTLTAYYPAGNATWTDSVRQNYGGTVAWEALSAPSVTTQPVSRTVGPNHSVTFSVTADGVGLSYQWQYRKNASDSWKKATGSGNQTDTMTFAKATATRDGYQYRCRITNAVGTAYSKAATLTVLKKAVITTQPVSVTAVKGTSAVFSVTATGDGLSYQWQYSKDGGSTWLSATAAGNKTATLTVPATDGRNGNQYRCKVINAAGNAYSKAATLTVQTPLAITTQPVSITADKGTSVVFSVKATGDNLTYQWQYSKDGGATWPSATADGNKTATLTVPATNGRNGNQYRCRITDQYGVVKFSDVVTLTVQTPLTITTQPVSITADKGTSVTFSVKATGDGLTYQWQYSKDGGATWPSATADGNKTATLTVPATGGRNGNQYRCRVTDQYGVVKFSDVVTLTVQ